MTCYTCMEQSDDQTYSSKVIVKYVIFRKTPRFIKEKQIKNEDLSKEKKIN